MACPYTELYIYHLEGRLQPGAGSACDSFIGLWQEGESAFMFFSAPQPAEVHRLLSGQPQARLVDSYHMPYDQWQGALPAAERIGRFRIVPPWETDAAVGTGDHPEELRLVLDPGVVFGAGTHPTTRDCLIALELAFAAEAAGTMLDLGTGTGILAVAAARLGCPRVLAVDLSNVHLNGLSERILVVQGRAGDAVCRPSDLVVANIHGEVMLRLLQNAGFRETPRLILSGLMRSEAKEVQRQLSVQGFDAVAEWTAEGVWHTYYAVRRRQLLGNNSGRQTEG
jgi:ribosomal protein L11 methyltransferase